jgi:hypothetical protein
MERIVDLDAAAREIESRRATWEQAGFVPGPLTWRDAAEPWPQTLKTDRTTVVDPDSVGVSLDFGTEPAATIVLFRGGWADVDVVDFQTALGSAQDGSDVCTPAAFGALLDLAVGHVQRSLIHRV